MPSDKEINDKLNRSIQLIEQAMEQALLISKTTDANYKVAKLAQSVFLLRDFQGQIHQHNPGLKTDIANNLDPELTPEQKALCAKLPELDLHIIDEALLANSSHQFRKVARVIGVAMQKELSIYELPDIFYAERVRALVKRGALEAQGNLAGMRYSEIKLP